MAAIIIRDVEDQLRNDFKAICAKKGISMKEGILRLMRQAVEKAALPGL